MKKSQENETSASEYEEFKKLLQQLDDNDFDFKSEMPEFYNDSIPELKSLQAIREDSPEAVEYNEYLRKLAEEDDYSEFVRRLYGVNPENEKENEMPNLRASLNDNEDIDEAKFEE